VVPAGTPPDIIGKLNAAINDGLKSQSVRESLARVGAQPAPGSPEDFGNFITDEMRKWSAIAQTAGLSAQ
jgi:tripartite-type tricarboxylate transporter receptor subunit TctC